MHPAHIAASFCSACPALSGPTHPPHPSGTSHISHLSPGPLAPPPTLRAAAALCPPISVLISLCPLSLCSLLSHCLCMSSSLSLILSLVLSISPSFCNHPSSRSPQPPPQSPHRLPHSAVGPWAHQPAGAEGAPGAHLSAVPLDSSHQGCDGGTTGGWGGHWEERLRPHLSCLHQVLHGFRHQLSLSCSQPWGLMKYPLLQASPASSLLCQGVPQTHTQGTGQQKGPLREGSVSFYPPVPPVTLSTPWSLSLSLGKPPSTPLPPLCPS